MRSFRDADGRGWDATVGRQSWGGLMLLFSLQRGAEVRTRLLAAETMLEAQQTLAALTEPELQQHLNESDPWQ